MGHSVDVHHHFRESLSALVRCSAAYFLRKNQLAILVHAATYPRRWVLVRSTNPGAFLQVTGLVLFFVPLIVSFEADGWYNELYWYRQIMGTRPGESLEATAMVALSWTQLALGASLLIWGTVVRQIWEDEEVQVEHPTLA